MRPRAPTEYDFLFLGLALWLTQAIYPLIEFEFKVPTELFCIVAPGVLALGLALVLDKLRFSAKLGGVMVLGFLTVFTILLTQLAGKLGWGESILLQGARLRPVVGAGVFLALLLPAAKPRLRWPWFMGLVVYWIWRSAPQHFLTLEPSSFLRGNFLGFILPAVLYLHLAGTLKVERRAAREIGVGARALRFLHLAGYVFLVVVLMDLTLNPRLIKLSPYLARSLELASPFGLILTAALASGVIGGIPLSIAFAMRLRRRSGG